VYTQLCILAAAGGGDQRGTFSVDGAQTELLVQDWGGFIGQWDNRLWEGEIPELAFEWPFRLKGLAGGWIKRDPVAWFSSHRHLADGSNDIYQYSYLYRYSIDVEPGAQTLTLPDNPAIKVLAISMTDAAGGSLNPAQPLYDTLEGREGTALELH
jgi:alpha-mannosidase